MLVTFAATLFCSAMLLFWVQPMVAKMLLPLLGGTPTVWNTCMVFFQAMLLAGYGYAHLLTTRCSIRVQTVVQLTLLLVTITLLPIGHSSIITQAAPWGSNPFLWLLGALFVVVALPFFTVSTSGPILQSWFSRTRHPAAKDPYFLYAASNLGSLIGLLGYPVLVEPTFRLGEQSWLWAGGYGLLVLLFAACATVAWRTRALTTSESAPATEASTDTSPVAQIGWPRRWRWIFWAFIPSSLMLGVTTYLATDIASVPMLWVVPLGIYLVTFILVFAQRKILRLAWLLRALPIAGVAMVFSILAEIKNPAWLMILIHLLFFFLAAMIFHTRLAEDRPPSRQLTEFYFCMSVGGVLGGLFNALLAPLIFRTVVEYRLIVVLACLALPSALPCMSATRRLWHNLAPPVGIGLLTAGLALGLPQDLGPRVHVLAVYGLPVILCYCLCRQPLRFGLALGVVLLASQFYTAVHGRTLRVERNFFGALRVTEDPTQRFIRLYHGTTLHGVQCTEPERQAEPLAYYHRTGPCGQAMSAFNSKSNSRQIGVIGLGAGAMAAYAHAGQDWTFYEIDPAVIRLARDTNYFTYLERCTNVTIQYKIGDARLRLREAPDRGYDLLVCDAFGSDVPPLHLLNRQAMELYLAKLAPGGLLLFHISSRYFDFSPVLGNLAKYFQLQTLAYFEAAVLEAESREGKCVSSWIALARAPEDFGPLQHNPHWHAVPPAPAIPLWTDDYSNILGIFQWR